MASSSENLMSNIIDPLAFMRQPLNDYWLSDLFSNRDPETLTLTRALQKSLEPVQTPTPTPTVSSLSGGSDPEPPAPKRQRNTVAAAGKIAKRKSRATKRSQTTFITADAANFRQMVQQITGVRFNGGSVQFPAAIIKPEPQRGFSSAGVGGRFPICGGGGACPPTLDTSALLLDQNRTSSEAVTCPPEMTSSLVTAGEGLDFDAFQSYPTLESWKVM